MGYCWRNTDWMLSISSDGVYNLIRISDWSIVASLATGKSLIPDGLVGGSWDAYGCNPSTGASWSKVKQTCVQWFAEPSVQLHGTMSEGTFSSSVYGMFDDNAKTKVEVKFSSYDELLSLDPASNGTKWSNSICTLTLANDIYTLSWTKDGTVITTLQGK